MKRLFILVLALVFASGFVFAQSNEAIVKQNHNEHQTTVNQTGESFAYVSQTNSHGSDGSISQITQIGANIGELVQSHTGGGHSLGSYAQLYQDGQNKAYFSQSGYNSEATVNLSQVGNRNLIVGSQSPHFSGSSGLFEISQNGDDNRARYLMGGHLAHSNTGKIDQRGDDDDAFLSQRSSSGNHAEIYQSLGKKNSAYLAQTGGGNNAVVRQEGENNIIKGDAASGPFNSGNSIFHTAQVGWHSISGFAAQKNISFLEVDQKGSFNELVLAQDNSESTLLQDGASNEIILSQEGSTANVSQLGTGNKFRLQQTGSGNEVGVGSIAPIKQDGDDNKFAGVSKVGDDLFFDIDIHALQEGGATLEALEEGGSYQKGNNNVIGLRQGAGDWALIQQDNNQNSALLWQSGGGQRATIQQDGIGNNAWVKQLIQ